MFSFIVCDESQPHLASKIESHYTIKDCQITPEISH